MQSTNVMLPTFWQKLIAGRDTSWLLGYVALLVIPWGLIFNRGTADCACVLVGSLWLWRSYKTKEWDWLRSPLMLAALAGWFWLLFCLPFAVDRTESFAVTAPWIRYVVCYVAATQWLLRDERALAFLAAMLAVMMVFILGDTLWQYVFGHSLTGNPISDTGRLTGPFDNVKVGIFVTKIIYPVVALVFGFAIRQRSGWRALFAVALLMVSIFVVLLTGERTAFSSEVIAAVFLAVVMAFLDRDSRKASFISVGVITAVVVALFLTQTWVQVRAAQFYQDISNASMSNYGQLVIAAYKIGVAHPLAGVGLKSFREACVAMMDSHEVIYCNMHPHNAYMEWLSGGGVPALAAIIAIVTILAKQCMNMLDRRRLISLALPLCALATLVVNFFPFMPTQSQFSNWPGLLLWYSVSVAMASLNLLKPEAKN